MRSVRQFIDLHDTCEGPTLNKTEWIYTRTKVRGPGSFELALTKMKERLTKCTFSTVLKTTASDITNCFRGCVGSIDRCSGIDHE